MPVSKPTISHQLKAVARCDRPRPSSVIHSALSQSNAIAHSPQTRSHLIRDTPRLRQMSATGNTGHTSHSNDASVSRHELETCTRLLRTVLSTDENKSTSTEDLYSKFPNSRCVAFKSPDLSSSDDLKTKPVNRADIVEGFDDRTDAESLTSIQDHKSSNLNTSSVHQKSSNTHSSNNNTNTNYCSCYTNNSQSMHDSRPPQGSGDTLRSTDKFSICSRCHNIIPSKNSSHEKEVVTGHYNKPNEEYTPGKVSESNYHNFTCAPTGLNDYKSPNQYNDITSDKYEDVMTYLHMKINDLQSIARLTRDADLGHITCEIERGFQQMIRENSTLSNQLKTIAKTLKWENSALKQKIKNQTESNRDMKSELKLIRQEQKQKIEELKLEVQLKSEEIRQINDRDKSNIIQLKEKYNALEKEYEKLKSEFQGQILQACHKDTDIIQLKHSCSQTEAKLKDEIHSLTLANQNLKQECTISQTLCKRYEQELSHNQSIIKAAREQVVNLLDRHKLGRTETSSCSFRFEPSCDASVSGEWIHQATSLQQVLSMTSENRDKQPYPIIDKYNVTPLTMWSTNNYFSNQQQPDQSNVTTTSINNFAASNFNNNYVSTSTTNPINSDSTNLVSNYDTTVSAQKPNVLSISNRSESPSNISSTLSNHSFNISVVNPSNNQHSIEKIRSSQVTLRRSSSGSDVTDDPWSLPQPAGFKKLSSASSVMSTVSSLRSCDDRDFRNGLKRLDSQISRLQSTLQSNLQCK